VDITTEAGTAAGSFYTYFSGKDEIFTAVLGEVQEEMLHPHVREMTANDVPLAVIEASNRAYLRAYQRNANLMRLLEQVANVDDTFRELRRHRSQAFARRNARSIEDLQRRGLADPSLDPLLAASVMVCAAINSAGAADSPLGTNFAESNVQPSFDIQLRVAEDWIPNLFDAANFGRGFRIAYEDTQELRSNEFSAAASSLSFEPASIESDKQMIGGSHPVNLRGPLAAAQLRYDIDTVLLTDDVESGGDPDINSFDTWEIELAAMYGLKPSGSASRMTGNWPPTWPPASRSRWPAGSPLTGWAAGSSTASTATRPA